jgi:hypothetical protein
MVRATAARIATVALVTAATAAAMESANLNSARIPPIVATAMLHPPPAAHLGMNAARRLRPATSPVRCGTVTVARVTRQGIVPAKWRGIARQDQPLVREVDNKRGQSRYGHILCRAVLLPAYRLTLLPRESPRQRTMLK